MSVNVDRFGVPVLQDPLADYWRLEHLSWGGFKAIVKL
mgnify:CR=1 FL=1|jgi:hypothetical protein